MGLLRDVLRTVEFLAGSDRETVEQFMVRGRSADYERHHVFWRAGHTPRQLVIPVSGESKCSQFNAEGREFIDRFFVSGECMGLICAMDGMPYPTDASVVRAGEFFTIDVVAFRGFIAEHRDVRDRATTMVGTLYRLVLREREDVALRPAPQRIAAFLLQHACVRQADGARVLLNATQSEIASSLGTVREVVSRVLSDFEQRGLLERGDDGMYVSDWAGLRDEAGIDPEDKARRGPAAGTERTARYFLPLAENRRRNVPANDAAGCAKHLGDLSRCREQGCPGAIDDDRRSKPQ